MARTASQNGLGETHPKFQSSTSPDASDVQAQIATLRTDVETLTSMLRDMAEQKVRGATAQAQEQAGHARTEVERQVKQLADTASAYQADAEAAVRANPGAAVGIATGIGFLAGLILARR